MRNILITGGAGFIGSTLADNLVKVCDKVVVIDNFCDYYSPALKEENVRHNLGNEKYALYKGDICDKGLLNKVFQENKIDVVVHIAANAGVRASILDPEGFVRVNIGGTTAVLEAMRAFGVRKIVFASSSSVYGNSKAEKFSEDITDLVPISPYAATKLACEQLLNVYSKIYDFEVVCLRFFTVFGPRQRPDLAIRKFVDLIEAGKKVQIYGDGTNMRDYTYVGDIVDGIIKAIGYKETKYEVINLGGGAPVKLLDMIEIIEDVLGKKVDLEYLPMQQGDVDKTVSDIKKARDLLGYAPKVGFKEGVKKFIEWRNGSAR